jgi:hypothetical protein
MPHEGTVTSFTYSADVENTLMCGKKEHPDGSRFHPGDEPSGHATLLYEIAKTRSVVLAIPRHPT